MKAFREAAFREGPVTEEGSVKYSVHPMRTIAEDDWQQNCISIVRIMKMVRGKKGQAAPINPLTSDGSADVLRKEFDALSPDNRRVLVRLIVKKCLGTALTQPDTAPTSTNS